MTGLLAFRVVSDRVEGGCARSMGSSPFSFAELRLFCWRRLLFFIRWELGLRGLKSFFRAFGEF